MMLKKGELTTQQLVIIIVLITSFAILLFFLFRLDLTETTDREVCHNSVIMRGNSVLPEETVPLNCHRSYVCLSVDGSCEKMTKPELKEVKSKEDVYQVLADEMADCWWMFGEGKINYVGTDLLKKRYCSICAQVAFDDSVKNIFSGDSFDKKELYDFLAQKKISGKEQTYSEYFLIGSNYISDFKEDFGEIYLDKRYYSLMGISSEVGALRWAGIGAGTATVVGLIFAPFTGGVSLGVTGSILAGVASGTAVGAGGYHLATVVKGESGNEYLSPSFVEIGSEEYKSLNCADISTLS